MCCNLTVRIVDNFDYVEDTLEVYNTWQPFINNLKMKQFIHHASFIYQKLTRGPVYSRNRNIPGFDSKHAKNGR